MNSDRRADYEQEAKNLQLEISNISQSMKNAELALARLRGQLDIKQELLGFLHSRLGDLPDADPAGEPGSGQGAAGQGVAMEPVGGIREGIKTALRVASEPLDAGQVFLVMRDMYERNLLRTRPVLQTIRTTLSKHWLDMGLKRAKHGKRVTYSSVLST